MTGRTVDGMRLSGADAHTGDETDTTDEGSNEATATAREGRHVRVRPEFVILIDYLAYRRGTTVSGETCEIPGRGPIPVELARQFADEAFIKAVISDGCDIRTVRHFGRSRPAELMTALMVRDRGCAVPDCTNTLGLEIDHIRPFAEGGELSLENAVTLCRPHHRDKTRGQYTLSGGQGRRVWRDRTGSAVARE